MEFQPGGTEEAARQQAMPVEQEETAALTVCQAQTDSRDPRSLCKAPNAYYLYPAGNGQMAYMYTQYTHIYTISTKSTVYQQ